MSTRFQLLERVVHIAPLGVRFWDAVTGAQVTEGLVVEAYPRAFALGRLAGDEIFGRRRARASPTGTYVLMNVPGLRRFESGEGQEEFFSDSPPSSPPGSDLFVIEVEDARGRFVPFSFEARLPARGRFVWADNPLPFESPPAPPRIPDGVPLYSAPARPVAAGFAAIRAEMWDDTTLSPPREAGRPAAYAVLEAHYKGHLLGRGVADEKGRIALIVPYPPPARLPQTSPPGSPPAASGAIPPLTRQEWTVDLVAKYEPASSPPRLALKFPDLRAVLEQRTANVWKDAARTELLTAVTLRFGRECFVQTEVTSPVSSPTVSAPPTALLITKQ